MTGIFDFSDEALRPKGGGVGGYLCSYKTALPDGGGAPFIFFNLIFTTKFQRAHQYAKVLSWLLATV